MNCKFCNSSLVREIEHPKNYICKLCSVDYVTNTDSTVFKYYFRCQNYLITHYLHPYYDFFIQDIQDKNEIRFDDSKFILSPLDSNLLNKIKLIFLLQ